MVSMIRAIRTFSTSLPKGRHIVSFWASKLFELSGIKNLFGAQLVAAVILAGVVSPQASGLVNQMIVEEKTGNTPIAADPQTLTTFEIPLSSYAISQLFSFWHPGIDMTAPKGTPIYAIESGVVTYADDSFFGYGRHVVIAHEHQIESLYGHMSEILTSVGKRISRGEMIGKVGSTGWSTGNHVHLEVHIKGIPVNPLEVLPIKKEEVKFEATAFSLAASPSAQVNNASPTPSL
jgi:murein DD-endopeptidase MepM/ murein hydrolase activator NlpD